MTGGAGPLRLFGLLLRLYPARHRRAYGPEMREVALYRWRRSGGGIRATVSGALDLAAGAAGVWIDQMERTTMGMGRGWILDTRFVARSLRRSPGYALTTVVVLACAVAANATVFSYVRGTLMYEAPYPDPASVMMVWGSNLERGQLRDVIAGPSYVDLQERLGTLNPVAAFHTGATYLMVEGRPEVYDANEVTFDFFGVLGVEPHLGRLFDERDRWSGAAETVVVTHGFWLNALGADPDAVGRVLFFEGQPRTVIGILPEGFDFLSPAPLYIPLRDDVLASQPPGNIHYNVLGRLVRGATVADANREAASVVDVIEERYAEFEGWSFLVEPLHEVSVLAVRPVILALAAAAGLVLLVGLLNLAMLFRIRGFARGAEVHVRAALGAGRTRIARIFLLETVGLALTGALLGLLGAPFLLSRVGELVPLWIQIPDSAALVPVLRARMDPLVASACLGGSVLGSALLTLLSFRTTLPKPGAAAHGRSVHPGFRGARLLVGVEVAVATTLCIGAALALRSTARLLSTDVGIEPEHVLTMYVGDAWGLDAESRTSYFRQVVDEVERVPGVRRAGVTGYIDFRAEDDFAGIYLLDRDHEVVSTTREEWRRVDEGLFEAVGIETIRGRAFESTDFAGPPRVAVVNRAFADKHYTTEDVIGSLVSTHNERYRELSIVGVVGDVRSLGPAAAPPPMLYVPYQGDPRGTQGLHVRTEGDPSALVDDVRAAIWSVDPSQPIDDVSTMAELVESWVAIPRASRALVAALASLAWLLSALGVFGVVAYAVRTRRSELGVRLALGASPGRLEADQLRVVAPVVALGVGIGAIVGLGGARAAASLLYGVSPLDPVAVLGALGVMTAATGLATYLPARRAGRVDPREVMLVDGR